MVTPVLARCARTTIGERGWSHVPGAPDSDFWPRLGALTECLAERPEGPTQHQAK